MNSNAKAAGQFPSGPSSENCDKQTAPASGRVGSKALVIGILAINPEVEPGRNRIATADVITAAKSRLGIDEGCFEHP
jgi:hypothetical protein